MIHKIKIDQKYLMRIIEEEKMFEVRLNDRDYQVGDVIEFNPIDNNSIDVFDKPKLVPYYKITYVHHGLGMQEGYVVLSIRQTTN